MAGAGVSGLVLLIVVWVESVWLFFVFAVVAGENGKKENASSVKMYTS